MDEDLIEVTRRILALRRRGTVSGVAWEQAGRAYLSAVAGTSDPAQLAGALAVDAEELLVPPDLKSATYERLLMLNGRQPQTLREYAWHLQIYGPDWDEVAADLLAEADQREKLHDSLGGL